MNIALIAHDKKKELMVQFCIAYSGILSKHSLYATGTTGKMIIENTGLNVYRFLSGPQGGDQQIGARIAYNEIDLVLFFRDPLRHFSARIDESLIRCRDLSALHFYCTDLQNLVFLYRKTRCLKIEHYKILYFHLLLPFLVSHVLLKCQA